MKKDTTWSAVSKWYDDHLEKEVGTYQRELILPNMLRLLAIEKGDRVLDLACGQGFFSRAFAVAGALVTGVDASQKLIAIAKERPVEGAKFYAAPAHALDFIADGKQDAIAIILAIQNIANPHEVLKECARVLAQGGRLLIVLTHPAFRVPKGSSWGFDEETRTQYRRVDEYLSEKKVKIQMHPGEDPESYTISFHRPLQLYVKLLSRAGFAITRLEEWNSHKKSAPGPRQRAEDRARKEIPLFMCIEARKYTIGE
jgi:ubiquinone/menaquinone biosynthesis C-methylase UbiE